jgi:thiol:disulfide interchange protein
MGKRTSICGVLVLCVAVCCFGAETPAPSATLQLDDFEASADVQFDAVKPMAQSLIAVSFKLGPGWHAYADSATAPAGMSLKLAPHALGITFGQPIFPAPVGYFDPSAERHIRVYVKDFTVYLPFTADRRQDEATIPVEIGVKSAICTDQLCTIKEGRLTVDVRVSPAATMDKPRFEAAKASPAASAAASTPLIVALPLAILAGLVLNIMPCVWPVLPIVIMRLISHAGETRGRSLLFGLAFSAGILLFFLAFAVVNIVLRAGFHSTGLSFADLSQNADYLIFMSLLLMVLAMFMFGAFNIGIPAWLTGKAGGGSGVIGSVGTGFLAAVLATPCSFGILVAVLVWAQGQPIPLATLTIMLIGVGMALPYLALTAVPHLMRDLPGPGRWMDIFKQAVGYILLVIAVKQVAGLPSARLASVLYYAPILAFAVWMCGSWVNFSTPARRKWTVRMAAVAIALAAGMYLLPAPDASRELIKWQPYDTATVEKAIRSNQPVLMDFTAAWCLNCTALDKVVYTRHDIADLIKARNVLPIRADVTLSDYPASAVLRDMGESAIPLNVLYAGGDAAPTKFRGVLIGADLKAALEALPLPAANPVGDANLK